MILYNPLQISPDAVLHPVSEPGEYDEEDSACRSDDKQGGKVLYDVAQHGQREQLTAGGHHGLGRRAEQGPPGC